MQDLRYALRGIRQKPAFTISVVATLALGIGANATMFGIVDRLLFRPPAYLASPSLVGRIYYTRTNRGKEYTQSYTGYRPYLDRRENTSSFDAMTPFYVNDLAVGTGDATVEMPVAVADADLWKMFDVKPVIGRFFTEAEAALPAGQPVAVLSYAFWQTRFGGHEDALGAKLDIGPGKYTVIGVAPLGFSGFSREPVVAFIPVAARKAADGGNPAQPWYSVYTMSWFQVFARRKPNISLEAASADLARADQMSYQRSLVGNPGRTRMEIAKPRAFLGPVLANRGPNASSEAKVATWLGGIAVLVLIIACANVANLLLARALRRRREIAVRIALGISRRRLATQLMTESVLLAALGGVAALAIARWGGAVVRQSLLGTTSVSGVIADARLLSFVGAVVLAVGLLTGLAPLMQTRRGDVAATLKAGSREGYTPRSRLRSALLLSQAALSVLLLVGAGLFVRSLVNVENIPLGYDADHLLWISPNRRGVPMDSVHQWQLRKRLLERAQSVPGVSHAALVLTIPLSSTWDQMLFVAGIDSVSRLGQFTIQAGTSDYFATSGTRILRGRGFRPSDDQERAPYVMVVSQTMAKKLWPNEDAIGKCVRMSADTAPCREVVGIAEDVYAQSLEEPSAHYYLPLAQFHPEQSELAVRTNGPAYESAEALRRALQVVMPGSAYVTATPMSTIIGDQTRSLRTGAIMCTVFGLLALVLAAIGLYSVIAYSVTQRTHEMGVRVALGAQAHNVIVLIVREGLRVVVPGVVLGAIITLVVGRWVAPLLYRVSPKDPPIIAGVCAVLIGVAIAASWIPARRASRVDPSEALRAD